MLGLGTTELLVIAGVIILLFGGKKLPGLGRSLGSAITNFKRGLNDPEGDSNDKNKIDSEKS